MSILRGDDENLIKAFEEAGLVPTPCRRIIIDIEVGEAVKLFYECYGDERMLQLDLPKALHNATRIRAVERPGVQDAAPNT